MSELSNGVRGTREVTVTNQNTARALGSGGLDVYATPAMIADPPPVASLMLMPKRVRPADVTVAVAAPCPAERKKGSMLMNNARRSAGDAITAV